MLKPLPRLLILRLVLKEGIIGAVAFFANESGCFTERHADLAALLKEPFAVAMSNCVRYKQLLNLKNRLADDNQFLISEINQSVGEEIIGADFGLHGVMEMVRQVAPLSSAVLLLGETGTGKELIARAIHRWSPRRKKPIIKVNCGALPVNLMDSELFGHEKGAFTGTLQKKAGRFERADGGTLFLYEIGELVPDTQIRLLRVLQEKELERVGGTETIRIDVRVIAATHRNLDQMVAHCMFREDLFFRLKVFPIVVPPLRDRKEDIPALVQHFIGKKAKEMGLSETPTVTDQSLSLLGGYHWPGNVRELENAVERALILCQGKSLSFEEFKVAEVPPSKLTVNDDTSLDRMLPLESVIDRHIRRALLSTKRKVGGKKGAAGILGLNPSTLRKKMKKLNIPFGRKASLNDI